MISASQIRSQLALALARKMSLDQFEDWFVQNTWNIHASGSKEAEVLTFAIEDLLSEYTSAHISEQALRSELEQAIHAETRIAEVIDPVPVLWAPQPIRRFRTEAPSASALVSIPARP